MNLFIDFFYKKTVIKYTANISGISKIPLPKPKISRLGLEISTKKHENSKSV